MMKTDIRKKKLLRPTFGVFDLILKRKRMPADLDVSFNVHCAA